MRKHGSNECKRSTRPFFFCLSICIIVFLIHYSNITANFKPIQGTLTVTTPLAHVNHAPVYEISQQQELVDEVSQVTNQFNDVSYGSVNLSPKLVIGILSKQPTRDELIYDVMSKFRGVRDGSVKILFARCAGIDDSTTRIRTNSSTAFVDCTSKPRPWELCDKTLGWLKFAKQNYPDAKFIAKADDDSLVHVDKLLSFMQNLSLSWPSSNLYVGRGMQIYSNLHNGMCFGPVPFIGGMIQIFSTRLIEELHCSNSIIGGMGEDFVLGHSMMHTQVPHVMVSCEECFHDKELPLTRNSMVVHGFKAGSEQRLLDTLRMLDECQGSKIENYNVVTYKSHINSMAPFHRWGDGCSNGCVSVVAIHQDKVDKFLSLPVSKDPIVAFDLGLSFEDFRLLSFEYRSKVDIQRFPKKDPHQQDMMERVSVLYNTTCVNWMEL